MSCVKSFVIAEEAMAYTKPFTKSGIFSNVIVDVLNTFY